MLSDSSILVTGGTGSFGRHFVKRVLDEHDPRRLAIFSRDEHKQYELQQFLAEHPRRNRLRFFLGDVRDSARLEMAMREVDYVIHAAALKQIPAAEYNPFECIHTNVIGAENVVRAALGTGVRRVLGLSTDKAASPINLYGTTKLAAERIFVAANHLSGSIGTRFSVVRYGNVVASRGSVIPHFRALAEAGADSLPITDERMTRFWITLDQGVEFVLSSLGSMRGGEVFVPKLPSMRIVDLARTLAPDLPHRVVGIRPGEKLHEVLVTADEARTTLEYSDRYVIEPAFTEWAREPELDNGGAPVEEGFAYTSDANPDWVDAARLASMLKQA